MGQSVDPIKIRLLPGNPLLVRYQGNEMKMETEVGGEYDVEF